MLDEYNTSEKLWAEAINTACYASNRLFLQKFLGKTPYELLNGKKPDVSFFQVFGYKCYIYKKHQHLGKFQRRCDIGFLVGYSSKSKAYRVFNHATGLIKETYDVEFDESNGSQEAIENCDDVGDEPLREAMKNMIKTMYKLPIHHLHHMCLKMITRMGELKMKILMSLINKPRHKLKMLMLPIPLLKWLIEETHVYFKHIHKISS
jgi:hypothetical protein